MAQRLEEQNDIQSARASIPENSRARPPPRSANTRSCYPTRPMGHTGMCSSESVAPAAPNAMSRLLGPSIGCYEARGRDHDVVLQTPTHF